ncbi:hypothetical protein GCM10022247_50150 [Allokutzneria multivorans]|uniref:Uncharacterized protein n=1 Tax=Allokutzneria multivorans TaxID=1142134 RepID=A0ABP7T3C8_9PSEU
MLSHDLDENEDGAGHLGFGEGTRTSPLTTAWDRPHGLPFNSEPHIIRAFDSLT